MKRKQFKMSDQLIGRTVSKFLSLPEGVPSSQERNKKKVRVGIRVRAEECAMTDEPNSVVSSSHSVEVPAMNGSPPVVIKDAFTVLTAKKPEAPVEFKPKVVRKPLATKPTAPPPLRRCDADGCDNIGDDETGLCFSHS